MLSFTNYAPDGRLVLTPVRDGIFPKIELRDSAAAGRKGHVAIIVDRVLFDHIKLACEAFNRIMSGDAEGYLAPTQPALPAEAAE